MTTQQTTFAAGAVLVLTLVLGCEKAPPAGSGSTPAAGDAKTPAVSEGTAGAPRGATTAPTDPATAATVSGKVVFDGTPPERKKVRMSAEPVCDQAHGDGALSEDLIVNADGTLRNVVVYVSKGLEGRSFPPPAEPVVLDQRDCLYLPHVLVAQVGQKVRFRNGDTVTHNIHGLARKNDEFNFGQIAGQTDDRSFGIAEIPVRIKCDTHPWMNSFLVVLPHPYHAVTGDDGSFRISGLPPGDYEISAWHEEFAQGKTEKVTLGAKEQKEIMFSFKK